MKHRGLIIGCGEVRQDGFMGVDIIKTDAVDVVHDLNRIPWPFEDESFEEVLAEDIIEHLREVIPTMEEIHRILKPDGIVHVRTPHYSAENSYSDPTHIHHLSLNSFDYFDPDTDFGQKYGYYTDRKFKLLEKKIDVDMNIKVVLRKT